MLPETNKDKSEDPVTPELPESSGKGESSKGVFQLPSAPKGKPKIPPLIHGRITPSDADNPVSNGSKIPLLKTKHKNSESSSKVFVGNYNGRRPKSPKKERVLEKRQQTSMEVHRTVEKVKVSKGIEMKRVVQESSGLKPKRLHSSTTSIQHSSGSSCVGASKVQPGNSAKSHHKKMTKVEASVSHVKSYSNHTPPGVSTTSSKHVLDAESQNIVDNLKKSEDKNNQGDLQPPASPTFKTVEEFLKMPETPLPDKPHVVKKPKIYKSKFWEYIDPALAKKSQKKSSPSKEQKKPYDSNDVKDFMLKQKEVRRQQQIKEMKEKQEEYEKRQRMLKQLDSKCQRIALKGKQRSEMHSPNQDNEMEIGDAKKPKIGISESPNMKYLQPLLVRRHETMFRKSEGFKSEAAKQAQYLLSEFENIVKRECISFLQKIPASDVPPLVSYQDSSTIEKADKAVGTSISFLGPSKEQSIELADDKTNDMKSKPKWSPSSVERAVVKIQAFYRGYKVRQALKDAMLLPRLKALQEGRTQNLRATHRRWSFPRLPEKPYDNSYSKLLPMSPIPTNAASDSRVPCYIPPPLVSSSQSCRSPPKPRVLPSFPLTPVRLRVYDEPFPKSVSRLSDQSDRIISSNQEHQEAPQTFHMYNRNVLENVSSPVTHTKSNVAPRKTLTSIDLGLVIDNPLPSVIDVLREKVRLFVDSNANAIVNNATAVENAKLQSGAESKSSEVTYASDFEPVESMSSAPIKSKELYKEDAVDRRKTIHGNSDVTSESAREAHKMRKHKRHSHSHSHHRSKTSRNSGGDSTTTIDTDMESNSSVSRLSFLDLKRRKEKDHSAEGDNKSDNTVSSSSIAETTASGSFQTFLAPALRLRYEAEKEHLQVIERALQVKLAKSEGANNSNSGLKHSQKSPNDEAKMGRSSDADRLQLAIANCHKESMKAAAEMAKWMAEFRKTTVEQDRVQSQKTPVDLAAVVYAAVEQAKHIGEEKRRDKELQRLSDQQFSGPSRHQLTDVEDVTDKADKCVETSLTLMKNERDGVKYKDMSLEQALTLSTSQRNLKDYQQQFPSESERESPAILSGRSSPLQNLSNPASKHSSLHVDYAGQSLTDEAVEYQSIIPSGNTIDFTSLEPKVSSVENENTLNESSINEDLYREDSFVDDFSKESSIKEHVSEQAPISEAFVEDLSKESSIERPVEVFFEDFSKESSYEEPVSEQAPTSEIFVENSSKESSVEEPASEQEQAPIYEVFVENSSKESSFEEPVSEQAPISEVLSKEISIEEPASEQAPISEVFVETSTTERTVEKTEVQSVKYEVQSAQETLDHSEEIEDSIKAMPMVLDNSEVRKSCEEISETKSEGKVSQNYAYEDVSFENEETEEEIVVENPKLKENVLKNEKPSLEVSQEAHLEASSTLGLGIETRKAEVLDAEPKLTQDLQKVPNLASQEVSVPLKPPPPYSPVSKDFVEDLSKASSIEEHVSEQSPAPISEFIVEASRTETEMSSEKSKVQSIKYDLQSTQEVEEMNDSKKTMPEVVDNIEEINSVEEISEELSECKVSQNENLSSKSEEMEEEVVGENTLKNEEPSSGAVQEVSLESSSAEELETKKLDVLDAEPKTNQELDEVHRLASQEVSVPLKPPPPYSPPSSLESTSLSSRSLLITLPNEKLERIIHHQADVIWQAWKGLEPLPTYESVSNMQDISAILGKSSEGDRVLNDGSYNVDSTTYAVQSFDALLCHLVYETIKEVLQVENSYTPYIERVRPGPLSLQAQKLRIPKSKDSLISTVFRLVQKTIPRTFFSDPQITDTEKPRLRKWCSRPRELVDEVLLEELVEEDYQWTEWWPEEVIVLHQVSEKIIKSLVRDSLKKRAYVFQH